MYFSVVIPIYNKSYSLKRCLDSVLAQNYSLFEIIIVNDGSTDPSLSIVKDNYNKEIESGLIKLLDQTNQGVSVARNNGVKISAFDFICFLDADDEWKPNFLQKMANLIKDFPQADLYSLAHMMKKEGKNLNKPKHGLPNNHRGYVKDFFEASSKGSVVSSSKVCVKKQAFLNIKGFPEGIVAGEDLYVWIRLALNGEVACDMSYSAIVHQENDNSREARKNTVPYPLIYFSENEEFSKNHSLNKYLFVIFYKHILSSLLSLKFKESSLRLKSYLKLLKLNFLSIR